MDILKKCLLKGLSDKILANPRKLCNCNMPKVSIVKWFQIWIFFVARSVISGIPIFLWKISIFNANSKLQGRPNNGFPSTKIHINFVSKGLNVCLQMYFNQNFFFGTTSEKQLKIYILFNFFSDNIFIFRTFYTQKQRDNGLCRKLTLFLLKNNFFLCEILIKMLLECQE